MKTIIQLSICIFLLAPAFIKAQATSYDADGDGIPDSTDQCAFVKGVKTDKGCPAPKKITADDRDGDGTPDAKDKCADMYGVKDAQGCPNLLMASATGQQVFTVESSTTTEESEMFKTSLNSIISEADQGTATTRTNGKTNAERTEAAKCLPGATCYIQNDGTKTFYADFGQYSSEAAAAERYYLLKNKLLEVLSQKGWTGSETAKGGYIDKYEMTKDGAGVSTPIVATHVKRVNDTYSVFVTVAKK